MQKILVIDDVDSFANIHCLILKRNGFEAFSACSDEQGLAEANRIVPDLILLDDMMPGLSGEEVFLLLRSKPETRHIPVILTTVRTEQSVIERAIQVGYDDIVVLPVHPTELVASVKNVLARSLDTNSRPAE